KIYRPGQTIYFKALVLSRQDQQPEIKAKHPVEVRFFDPNQQEVGKLKLTTNEFGSVQGSFVAPQTGLTGNMRLVVEGGATSISVEEYKRPKFETTFLPITGTYQLNSEVAVTGQAKAYAGSNIDGAIVRYRVIRETSYPYFWGYFRRPYPRTPQQEILSGETSTDAEGKFTFTFEAQPDPQSERDLLPVFRYQISADVVDISGETQSASTALSIGYTSLQADWNVPKTVDLARAEKFDLSITNLSGQKARASTQLVLQALQAPKRNFRPRKWTEVDQHILSQAEFYEKFPFDQYEDEGKPENWTATTLRTRTIEVEGKSTQDWSDWLTDLDPGHYALEWTINDPSGELIKKKAILEVVNSDRKKRDLSGVLSYHLSQTTAQPGETVQLSLSTSEKKTWVIYELAQGGKLLDRQFLKLKRKKKSFLTIPIKESHRGNIQITVTGVKNNAAYLYSERIQVPWTNKQLQLSWSTFRDKLTPGQDEQWKLTIKGPQKEAVAAEMVATLYDASLDVFRSNSFGLDLYPTYQVRSVWETGSGFRLQRANYLTGNNNYYGYGALRRGYDRLITMQNFYGFRPRMARNAPMPMADNEVMALSYVHSADAEMDDFDQDGVVASKAEAGNVSMESEGEPGGASEVSLPPTIRTNLEETAFFFPQLQTDEEGNIVLNFTIPEALTRWKFLGLAHTKELQMGTLGGETVTQKELMVFPNLPRFLREGDELALSAKVSNLTEEDMDGTAEVRLLDAFSLQPIHQSFGLTKREQAFSVKAGQSTPLSWDIKVPENVPALIVQILAKTDKFSDGEENALPILKNRLMVTESIPLAVRGMETKEFVFEKLVASDSSSTLQHQQLTLEFTSNPAWYAVQALPYLMEYPFDCTEQIFSRFYANSLASHVANSSPRIQQVFNQWKQQKIADDGSLLSQLEKNQELKGVLLEETPWVLNARSERERKQRIGLLFDLNRMSNEQAQAWRKLKDRQHSSGAFSWFPGMRPSRYITQLLVTGIGHLQKLGVAYASGNPEIAQTTNSAIQYLDREVAQDYNRLKSRKAEMDKNHLSYHHIQYLYMRTFFKDQVQTAGTEEAFGYYYGQAQTYWRDQSQYMQGMLSLVFHRNGDQTLAAQVLKGLKQSAVMNEALGMYWKDMSAGWFWYQAPIERHALMIEAFNEITKDLETVDELKIWLLKNKQTHDWKTTRATSAAVQALLSTGTNWLEQNEVVAVTLGEVGVDPFQREDTKVEAGTGYFKTAWQAEDIQANMGQIKVSKKDEGIAWGALYWQYFEQLDKITPAATPLSLKKELFVKMNSEQGPRLITIQDNSQAIKRGDRLVVRIELRVDRGMEYVHMKDLRAAAFEPTQTISRYQYKNGLGYYQSTRDVGTDFFFEYLPAGTHVFEYELLATQQGDFSNGITTIQCMYAPEFTSHSEGIRVKVE
ncbi:MAG: alpha-2-macroglobulin family protein, partial [Bacteroidota bacterium]